VSARAIEAERTRWLFVAPALAALAAVTLYPLAHVAWLSLRRRQTIFGISEFTGLENYARLLADDRFRGALGNTAYFTAVSVAVEVALGLAIAVLLSRTLRARGLMRALVLVPWAVPTVVSAQMWALLYNPDFGALNALLAANVNWLGSPFLAMNAAIAMEAWKTTPFVALLLLAGLQTIPQDLYRAARVDGASAWTTFRRITLPALAPLMLVTALLRSLDALRVFDSIYVLTGGGPANTTETLSIYGYKLLFQTLQFGYGSTVAVATFACAAAVGLAYGAALRRSWA